MGEREEHLRAGCQALAAGYIRRRICVVAVKAQAHFLLGRLEGLGSVPLTAAGRRRKAVEMERQWRRERQVMAVAAKLGQTDLRRGFIKLD